MGAHARGVSQVAAADRQPWPERLREITGNDQSLSELKRDWGRPEVPHPSRQERVGKNLTEIVMNGDGKSREFFAKPRRAKTARRGFRGRSTRGTYSLGGGQAYAAFAEAYAFVHSGGAGRLSPLSSSRHFSSVSRSFIGCLNS